VSKREFKELRYLVEKKILDEAIRDTADHDSSTVPPDFFNVLTLFVENGLDQDVTVQLRGARVDDVTKGTNVGTSFTVAAGSRGFKTYNLKENLVPFYYARVKASVAPTSGSVVVYAIKRLD